MKKMVVLYIESIFNRKVFLITCINFVLMSMINIIICGVNLSKSIQIEYSETLRIDYLYQGLLFIKLNLFLLIIIMVHSLRHTMSILILHSIEQGRRKAILTYILSNCLILVILSSVLYLIFLVTGYYLTDYFSYENVLLLYVRLVMFVVYYYLLLTVIYLSFKTTYSLLTIFLVYLFTVLMTGFNINISESVTFTKVIHLYVSDLVLTSNLEYTFMYSDLYQLSIILTLLFVLVVRFSKIDLL